MSVYKNSVSKVLLPFIRRNYNRKNVLFLWNTTSKINYSTYSMKQYAYNKNLPFYRNQFQNIHITSINRQIISFNLSDIGEGIREVIVKEWFVKEGDKVSQFDNICEVQSDKASVTITSRYDGVVTKLYHKVDDIALVGKPLIDIETSDSSDITSESNVNIEKPQDDKIENANEAKTARTNAINVSSNGVLAIPSVRRIAKENKITLSDVKGTGKSGRILKEDILRHLNSSSSSTPLAKNDVSNEVTLEPVRGYRRAMIKTMTEAMKIPHFVYHDELKVTNLVKLRGKLKKKSKEINIRITYLPFFIKATSNALERYPVLNSRFDDKIENIIYNKSHNIGIAMDTATGLAVPVIQNVQDKNIVEISKELARLQDLGSQAKFSQRDLSGGTFSFSNIGAIGGTYAKPIILPPQSAIIALGSFQKLPRFADDETIVNEVIAYISAAADHRLIDGATMARFCNFLKQQIEEPNFLLMNL